MNLFIFNMLGKLWDLRKRNAIWREFAEKTVASSKNKLWRGVISDLRKEKSLSFFFLRSYQVNTKDTHGLKTSCWSPSYSKRWKTLFLIIDEQTISKSNDLIKWQNGGSQHFVIEAVAIGDLIEMSGNFSSLKKKQW